MQLSKGSRRKTRDFSLWDFLFCVVDECLSNYCNSKKTFASPKISVYVPGTWMVFDTIINSLLIPGFEIMILHWPVMKFVIPVLSPKLIGIKNFLFKS